MAVHSLPPDTQKTSPSFAVEEESTRGRSTMEREKKGSSHNMSPSQKTTIPRSRAKGKEKSTMEMICSWIVEHQLSISVQLLSALLITHLFFPETRHHTQKFYSLSYFNEQTNQFASGWDDIFFVFFWIIVFTGLRCATMDYLLTPLAGWAGIKKKKAQTRFTEQAWILLYPIVFWSCGMYIMYNSKYWLNLKELWTDFPSRELPGLTKWYYLVQFAFWLQQIVVVNIEERRKDHWQMFSHHIITCTLIFTSYGYHQSRVGNLILSLMDISDIFLPLAKVLKYLKYKTLCDATFVMFMLTWFVARHIFYSMVCWSIFNDVPHVMNYGCFRGSSANLEGPLPVPNDWDHLIQPFYDPEGLVCMDDKIRWSFLGLLLSLQVILLYWFTMIMNVAYKVIRGQGADDTRSDGEDSEGEEEEEEEIDEDEKTAFIEEEVGVESMHLSPSRKGGKSSPGRLSRKSDGNASASGVSIRPGDRKELLGRIGCDKGA